MDGIFPEKCKGMNHVGDDSQSQAQDYLGCQPHHDPAHGPWPSWDM